MQGKDASVGGQQMPRQHKTNINHIQETYNLFTKQFHYKTKKNLTRNNNKKSIKRNKYL